MYVYNKRHRLQKHYAGGGIFDTISNVVNKIVGNASVRNAATKLYGMAYLFKSIRYQLDGQDLEYINNP